MSEMELRKKIAYLEFVNDQLKTELNYVDELMRLIGFANGLDSVKEAANDISQDIPYLEEGELE